MWCERFILPRAPVVRAQTVFRYVLTKRGGHEQTTVITLLLHLIIEPSNVFGIFAGFMAEGHCTSGMRIWYWRIKINLDALQITQGPYLGLTPHPSLRRYWSSYEFGTGWLESYLRSRVYTSHGGYQWVVCHQKTLHRTAYSSVGGGNALRNVRCLLIKGTST